MTIREEIEVLEKQRLSPLAVSAIDSLGRERAEEQDVLRTCFMRDRDRIIHSKAFRRLNQKTQVYITPSGDHYRTRLTHTLEVNQIAKTIGKALRLNEDLMEVQDLKGNNFTVKCNIGISKIYAYKAINNYVIVFWFQLLNKLLHLFWRYCSFISCLSGRKQ